MHFDEEFFKSIGLEGASDDQKMELADQIAQTVQNRVAERLTEVLTAAELDEFEKRIDQSDEAAQEYLNEVYPDYPILMQEEIVKLKAELSQDVARANDVADEKGL